MSTTDPTALIEEAGRIVVALMECDEELRAEAIELFKQLRSGELDVGERFSTIALLEEILFPNGEFRVTTE